jgi:hypothetical protein
MVWDFGSAQGEAEQWRGAEGMEFYMGLGFGYAQEKMEE